MDNVLSLEVAADLLGCSVPFLMMQMAKDGLLLPAPGEPGRFIPAPHPDIVPLQECTLCTVPTGSRDGLCDFCADYEVH